MYKNNNYESFEFEAQGQALRISGFGRGTQTDLHKIASCLFFNFL